MKHVEREVILISVLLASVLAGPVHAGFSGDPAVDGAILPAYTLRAGGSDPGVDRNGNVWKCGTLDAHPLENKCPNSATFAPAEATGGKQSWGVGVAYVFFEDFDVACGVKLQPNFVLYWPYIIFEWQPYCEIVPTIIPGGTLLFDPDEALDTFVAGAPVPGGDGERDGNGVSDIQIFFQTYSYPGF